MAYAAKTTVSVEKSRWEIDKLLRAHHADEIAVLDSIRDQEAVVQFRMKDRRIRFTLDLAFDMPRPSQAQKDQFVRTRWRALLLTIKAKLESVAASIEVFEEAFLSQTVTADNMTVYDRVRDAIENGGKTMLDFNSTPLLSHAGSRDP